LGKAEADKAEPWEDRGQQGPFLDSECGLKKRTIGFLVGHYVDFNVFDLF